MRRNNDSSSHWLYVVSHFLCDAAIFLAAFGFAAVLRFQDWLPPKAALYIPSVVAASFAFPCLAYVSGLYSRHGFANSGPDRTVRLFLCLLGALLIVLTVGSINFSARVGRGVLLVGIPLTTSLAALHHFFLHRSLSRTRSRIACLVSTPEDETSASLFLSLGASKPKLAGLVTTPGYTPSGDLPVLGELSPELVASYSFDTLLVRDAHLAEPATAPFVRRLRYAGIAITSLADACEDIFLAVPLELVTENWLARASWQPGLFYVKKFKRAFDIIIALALAFLLSPVLLLGILLVRLTSRGPVFYTQTRLGRLEKPFTIFKLRSMRLDAEADGARWSSTKKDTRVLPTGKFLRKFRIDEIPQLLNILRGDMTFVGPRPERPEFVRELSTEIPHYHERSLIQPGLTGCQVRFPYGASIDDTKRKLEYDLYYLKHMSIVLDLFIILDTVRIILRGGASTSASGSLDMIRQQLRDSSPDHDPHSPAGRTTTATTVGSTTG